MTSHQIRLSEDRLLAEYVPLSDFQGWAKQQVAVDPDLLAVLIRDGKVAASGPGGNFGVGGLWRGVKDALIGQHSLRLLIADLNPFHLTTGLNAITRDKVPVGGEITIEFQINPENGTGVLGLMRKHSAVFKEEVMARIAPHVGDRVLENVIGQMDAADLRGSTMVQDKVQAEVMREVERVFGDMSLMVRSVSMRWEMNAEEIAAIEKRESERAQERADTELSALEREVAREQIVTELRIKANLTEEQLKAVSEDQLRTMVLEQELAFIEARSEAAREQEMTALKHELAMINTERDAKLKAAIENAKSEIEIEETRSKISDIQRRTKELDAALDQKISDAAQKANIDRLRELEKINDMGNQSAHEREMERLQAEAKAAVAKLEAQGKLTPEMLLALQAGDSTEAATALVGLAQAKGANSSDSSEMMKMIQGMMESKDDQARYAMDSIVKATVGVAEGAGGGIRSGSASAPASEIACPNCVRHVPATANFCHHCGHVIRT